MEKIHFFFFLKREFLAKLAGAFCRCPRPPSRPLPSRGGQVDVTGSTMASRIQRRGREKGFTQDPGRAETERAEMEVVRGGRT